MSTKATDQTKPQKRTVNEVEAKTLIFKHGNRLYLWGEGETSEVVGPTRITDVNTDWGSGRYFVFYVADCFSPPLFVVQQTSFENAYEEFIDWQVDQIKIEEPDLKDYKEDDLNFTSNGVPVDTEAVQGFEVVLTEARL